jgi:hypothetical protein
MAVPQIHLNGSSRTDLLDQFKTAYIALAAARYALQQAAPHARDYYVISPGAFEVAREQHESRLQRINDVLEELQSIAIVIDDVQDKSSFQSRKEQHPDINYHP